MRCLLILVIPLLDLFTDLRVSCHDVLSVELGESIEVSDATAGLSGVGHGEEEEGFENTFKTSAHRVGDFRPYYVLNTQQQIPAAARPPSPSVWYKTAASTTAQPGKTSSVICHQLILY